MQWRGRRRAEAKVAGPAVEYKTNCQVLNNRSILPLCCRRGVIVVAQQIWSGQPVR
jgi:hypothetical protein